MRILKYIFGAAVSSTIGYGLIKNQQNAFNHNKSIIDDYFYDDCKIDFKNISFYQNLWVNKNYYNCQMRDYFIEHLRLLHYRNRYIDKTIDNTYHVKSEFIDLKGENAKDKVTCHIFGDIWYNSRDYFVKYSLDIDHTTKTINIKKDKKLGPFKTVCRRPS